MNPNLKRCLNMVAGLAMSVALIAPAQAQLEISRRVYTGATVPELHLRRKNWSPALC